MIRVDPEGRKAFVDGQELALRRREFDVLAFLYLNFGKVVTREDILAFAYAKATVKPDSRAVDNAVKRLRKKLPAGLLRTVWGVGYVLEVEIKVASVSPEG